MSAPAPRQRTPCGSEGAFRLRLPAGWIEFDPDPRFLDASIDDVLRGFLGDNPDLAGERAGLRKMLRRMGREAAASGARYLATLPARPEQDLLAASLTISVIRPGQGSSPSLADLSRELRVEERRDGRETWQRVDTVDVPGGGTAARSCGVQDLPLPGTGGATRGLVRCAVTQVLLPLTTGSLLVLNASSPQIAIADAWLDLFDAIVGTLEIGRLATAVTGQPREE